jgi:hypothetical protein
MAEDHSPSSGHGHPHSHQHGPAWKRLHRDWRAWAVVILMLAAMLMYVLSDNESLQPGGGPTNRPMPAAAGS